MRILPVAAGLLASLTLVACAPSSTTDTYSDDQTSSTPSSQSTASSTPSAMTSSSAASGWDGTLLTGKHRVVLSTTFGNITLELDADAAPKTVTNFVTHVKNGYYDNLTFHRVIPGFMIQGGDPIGNGTGGDSIYGAEFEDEIDPSSPLYQTGYKKGVIAMANRGPNTNGSQFFIMETDYPLPPSYTIFGKVIGGQDVVSKIANVERGQNDRPVDRVVFSARVAK